jgi:hypothetical protein
MARNLNGKEANANGYVHGGDEKHVQGGAREIPLVFGQDECVHRSRCLCGVRRVATHPALSISADFDLPPHLLLLLSSELPSSRATRLSVRVASSRPSRCGRVARLSRVDLPPFLHGSPQSTAAATASSGRPTPSGASATSATAGLSRSPACASSTLSLRTSCALPSPPAPRAPDEPC